jgi:hypothetical protein
MRSHHLHYNFWVASTWPNNVYVFSSLSLHFYSPLPLEKEIWLNLHTSVKFTKLLATAEMKSRVLLQNIPWNEMDRTAAGNSTKRRLYRAYYWKCVEPRPFIFMILELKEASGGVCVPEARRCRWRASALRDNTAADVNTAETEVQMTSTVRTRYPTIILFN